MGMQVLRQYRRTDELKEFTVRAAPGFAVIAERAPVVSLAGMAVLQDADTHELVTLAVAVLLPEMIHRRGDFTPAAVLALHDEFTNLCFAAFGPECMAEVIELDALREEQAYEPCSECAGRGCFFASGVGDERYKCPRCKGSGRNPLSYSEPVEGGDSN